MKKIIIGTVMALCLTSALLISQTKGVTIPFGSDKILVNGHSQYLGYLNAYLNLAKNRSPLAGQTVYLDALRLTDRGGGLYTGGTPFAYDVTAMNTIVIKLKQKGLPVPGSRTTGDIVLGTYAVKNHIQWVHPLPDAVLPLARPLLRTVKFRWNYTGTVLNTKVTLKNFSTNTELFTATVTAEEIDIPAHLLTTGNRYRFDLEVLGPMGQFKLTDATAPGSKIDFFYWAHMYFQVK